MNADIYNLINQLLSEYSTVDAALKGAQSEITRVQLAAAASLLPEHAQLKIKLTDLEAKLRKLADEFATELFPEATGKRSHETPFGTLKNHKSSSLEYEDDETVVLKIKLACDRELARVRNTTELPRFTMEQLIRTTEAPNLLAMAGLDDVTLSLFGIQRVQDDNFKVAPFTMKSDKPAKAAKGEK